MSSTDSLNPRVASVRDSESPSRWEQPVYRHHPWDSLEFIRLSAVRRWRFKTGIHLERAGVTKLLTFLTLVPDVRTAVPVKNRINIKWINVRQWEWNTLSPRTNALKFLARSAPTTDGGLCLDKVAVFGTPLQWLIIQSPQGTAREYQWGLRSVPDMTISSMKPTVSEIDFRKFTRSWYSHRVCPVLDETANKQLLVMLHWEHYPDTGFVSGSSWKRECQYLIDKIKSSPVSQQQAGSHKFCSRWHLSNI